MGGVSFFVVFFYSSFPFVLLQWMNTNELFYIVCFMVELFKTRLLCLMLIFGASSINNTMSKINPTPSYLNKAKKVSCTQTIEKHPLWAGAAAGRCFFQESAVSDMFS